MSGTKGIEKLELKPGFTLNETGLNNRMSLLEIIQAGDAQEEESNWAKHRGVQVENTRGKLFSDPIWLRER